MLSTGHIGNGKRRVFQLNSRKVVCRMATNKPRTTTRRRKSRKGTAWAVLIPGVVAMEYDPQRTPAKDRKDCPPFR